MESCLRSWPALSEVGSWCCRAWEGGWSGGLVCLALHRCMTEQVTCHLCQAGRTGICHTQPPTHCESALSKRRPMLVWPQPRLTPLWPPNKRGNLERWGKQRLEASSGQGGAISL